MSKKHRISGEELMALTQQDAHLFHDAKGQAIELPKVTSPLADTHGHLTHFRKYDAPMALARAALAGVALLGVPVDPTDDGSRPAELLAWLDACSEEAHHLIDQLRSWGVEPAGDDPHGLLNNIYLWAGTHPYGAADFNASDEAQKALIALLDSARTVGIGEIGLDYGPYNKTDPDEQKKAFAAHLRVAHERNLPVELHIRDADGDALAAAHVDAARILEQEGVPAAGCDLHCYTSDERVMLPFVEMGCYVAFGGAATFGRSDDIRRAAVACPGPQILSETDSPYMAPMPLRGMECEPAMVAFSAALVAETREVAGVCGCSQTYADLWHNARRLFGLD